MAPMVIFGAIFGAVFGVLLGKPDDPFWWFGMSVVALVVGFISFLVFSKD